jgi:hypothetical protein
MGNLRIQVVIVKPLHSAASKYPQFETANPRSDAVH